MSLVLDRYEVVRRLAVGGMGEVFLAVQRGAGDVARSVILKAMLPDLAQDPAAVQAFLDEARVIATLNHPNVVSLYEVGVWQGLPLIAMEFVRGRTVSGLIKRCLERAVPLPPGVALTIARDAARGLHHAHEAKDAAGHSQHLIHRDISPQNIMVRLDGVAKVLDFGIAHTALRASRTATGLVKGKLAYMAPEQARGDRLDQRADQFALGIVLWEMLTLRRLYKADDELQLLEKVQAVQVPPASSLGAPAACDALLARMLSPQLEARFADCGQLASALDELVAQVGGGGAEAVAALMVSLGEDDLDASTIPSLGDAVSPFLFVPPARADVRTATVPGRPALISQPLPVRRRTWWPAVVVLILLAAGGAGLWGNQRSRATVETETRLRVVLEQNARFAAKTVESFCADSARLAPLFPRVEGPWHRSASPFFEGRIGWEDCAKCEGPWEVRVGSLEPPARLVEKAKTPEDASVPLWRTVFTREDLATLDFRWLDELSQFDHWWLSEHPRTQQWHGSALEGPMPNLIWIQWWAKLRFARALLDDDLPAASAQLAQLRRLMRTQGLLVSEMISLSLQGLERNAIEEAQLRGLNTAGLTPVSPAQVIELRSVAFAGRTYAWPGVDPSVMERAYACSLSPCVMLGEAAWLHGMAGQLAKTDTRASFEALLQRSECDRESITRALRAPADLSQFKDSDLLDPLARVLEKL